MSNYENINNNYYENMNLYGNLYEILNLSQDATKNEIKISYKKLILKYHPDKNSNISSDKFLEIKYAYDILSDNEKRRLYDNKLRFESINISNMNLTNYFTIKNINSLIGKFIDSTDIDKILKILINKNIFFDNNLIENLFIKNNINFMKKIINIDIIQNFTLKEVWLNIPKKISYKRETKDLFEELIYPVDFEQIYENEGEKIKINNNQYNGNIRIKINITESCYNNESYFIHNDELYLLLNTKRIINNKFTINFIDGNKYKFNLNKLSQLQNELGLVYMKKNFGFLKYNIIDDLNYITTHGNLFFILLI